jgi:CBS domain containing-hemolysin-like protein
MEAFFATSLGDPIAPPETGWESPLVIVLKLLAIVFLVLLNGFFVASEFAIVKVRSSQLDALAVQGVGRARLAQNLVSNLDAYLSATQLGVTLASLGLGWLGEPFLAEMIEPFFTLMNISSPELVETVSFAVAFVTITMLHIVLGELAPKSLAITKALPTSLWISWPLRFFYLLFKPAVSLLNGMANWLLKRVLHLDPVAEFDLVHSEEELRWILNESANSAKISRVSNQIVAKVFELRRRLVREIVTPWSEVVCLDPSRSFRENLKRAMGSPHTRFPLCSKHFDHAIGLVHAKNILAQLGEHEPSLLAIREELIVVPETMPLEKLLTLLRDRRASLAVVVNEFGNNVGIVTIQRVIAEVIGHPPQEFYQGSAAKA